MAITPTNLRSRFPEFLSPTLTDALIQEKLDQAARQMDAEVWGDKFNDGQAQKAAHLLALTPFAQEAGLRMGGGSNQRTVYQDEFERLERMVGTAYRVVLP